MALKITPRLKAPATAKQGEIIEIKTIVNHPMENGLRRDLEGRLVPRNILRRFSCHYDGRKVLDVMLEPSIAANPYFGFFLKADRSGSILLRWEDESGQTESLEHVITIE